MKTFSFKIITKWLLSLLLICAPSPSIVAQTLPPLTPVSPSQPPRELNSAEIGLALKKLQIVGSVLYIAAHPDDENTAMLAYLANERLVRTGYLSLTRGDGGQNLIGAEKGELLGVIRTQELLAARRIDGAEQFFTRAIDFGYSKTPDETLRFWGEKNVLSDVVWVIRRFRPDVIITRFPTTGEGGHGHHTASAILAGEAFKAAGDAGAFPEQLKYVSVWQPKRIFWNTFNFNAAQNPFNAAPQNQARKLLSVDVGAYNALLGQSYTEIAATSRSQHKSQGFGSAQRRGTAINYLQLLAGDTAEKDVFDDVDLSWRRIKGGEKVGRLLEEANQKFEPQHPEKILPLLIQTDAALEELQKSDAENATLLATKRRELLNVITACAGLSIEALTTEATATPGSEVKINLTLVNRSGYSLRLERVNFPFNNAAQNVNAELKPNQPLVVQSTIKLPDDIAYSQPYWLQHAPDGNLFSVADQRLIGTPENAPALPLTLKLNADNHTLNFETPALYRFVDRVRGEVYRPFEIVPSVTVNLENNVYIFPDAKPKQIQVTIKSFANDEQKGKIVLQPLNDWKIEPEAVSITLRSKGDEAIAKFFITPKNSNVSSFSLLRAIFIENDSKKALFRNPTVADYAQGFTQIEHSHIPAQLLFPPAEAKLVKLDLQKRGQRIGYVMGAGDEVPEALRQVRYEVTLLSDRDLDDADLKNYDAIITGVRAYNTRPRLRQQQQQRLLDYVSNGGTLVVQYNTVDESVANAKLGPYPLKVSNERVTDETAHISFVQPQHPLLTTPNKITDEDFTGWIQERGLYFAKDWDARYETPLACHDPNEMDKRGGLLYARYGKGVYIYTSYAFFRQLPAGVPGAYRLFVNMVSAGK